MKAKNRPNCAVSIGEDTVNDFIGAKEKLKKTEGILNFIEEDIYKLVIRNIKNC